MNRMVMTVRKAKEIAYRFLEEGNFIDDDDPSPGKLRQLIVDVQGKGLCTDFAEAFVLYVADNYPEFGAVPGDADGGLIAEFDLADPMGYWRKHHLGSPCMWYVQHADTERDWVPHYTAVFPDPDKLLATYVDLTPGQFCLNDEEPDPCPLVWRGPAPEWLRPHIRETRVSGSTGKEYTVTVRDPRFLYLDERE